jgi:hypothetical protein
LGKFEGLAIADWGKEAAAGAILGLPIAPILVVPFLAIILGSAALRRVNKPEGRFKGRGMAIAGIVLGAWAWQLAPLPMRPRIDPAYE